MSGQFVNLSVKYCEGDGVEVDRVKEKALLERATIAGHPEAGSILGFVKMRMVGFIEQPCIGLLQRILEKSTRSKH